MRTKLGYLQQVLNAPREIRLTKDIFNQTNLNKYSVHCFWFNTVDIIKIDFEESQFYFTGNSPKIPSISITLENLKTFPAGIYLFKVNNRNTRTRSETCSKLTIKKTLE